MFPLPYQCMSSGPPQAGSQSYRYRLGQSWCGGMHGNSHHCWLRSCSQSPFLSLEKCALVRILQCLLRLVHAGQCLHFLSPLRVPFCARGPVEANKLQQGKDENSSAQGPPPGREAQITKINGRIPGNAPCGLCGPDLWGRLWTGPEMKQTADKAASIPVKLQDVLPTKSWLSLL